MDEQNLFLKIIEDRFDRFLDSYIVTGGDTKVVEWTFEL